MKWFKKPITLAQIDILGVLWNMPNFNVLLQELRVKHSVITTWAIINYYITIGLLMFQDTVEYCMVSVPMNQLHTYFHLC